MTTEIVLKAPATTETIHEAIEITTQVGDGPPSFDDREL